MGTHIVPRLRTVDAGDGGQDPQDDRVGVGLHCDAPASQARFGAAEKIVLEVVATQYEDTRSTPMYYTDNSGLRVASVRGRKCTVASDAKRGACAPCLGGGGCVTSFS